MSESLSVNEIINLVRESNKSFESEVFVPSLNKEIHTKPMNASHLKSIIKTTVSGVFANNTFNQTLYVILKDILDPSIPTTVITNFDKLAILLQLRKRNVKPSVEVELTSGEQKKTVTVSLDTVINKIKKGKFTFDDQVITDGDYSITLRYPSIDQEFLFDRHFEQTRIKKIDETDKAALKELFGPLFIQELTQYVASIKIKDQEVNVLALPVGDRLAIVESLSSSLVTKIIETIDTVFGKQINKILDIEKEIDGEKFTGSIQIDPSLFS